MINIILFGPPGAGKGTQSEKLIKHYQLTHISTGDIFRYNIKNATPLGKEASQYIDKGQLVPDHITIEMLKSEMKKYPHTRGFIFDGFPRTIQQAEALDELLKEMNTSVSVLLSLEVGEEELRNRLMQRAKISGRTDDADPSVIENRISVYKKETEPVKEYYAAQNKLVKIKGEGTIEEIFARICDAIEKKTPMHDA